MKKTNKSIKSTYQKIFKKGYTKVYTVNTRAHTDKASGGLKITGEMKEALAETGWKGKKVLEVGCGTGTFAYAVSCRGAEVLAIDYIESAIKEAQNTYQHKNLEYGVGDAATIKGKFDVIVSLGTLEHLDDPLKILKRFKRHLAPGGKIIITSPNWTNPRGYVLQTLRLLFDTQITLADLHYLTPVEFKDYAKKLGMSVKWHTFDFDWAHGERLLRDFRDRLPKILPKGKLPAKQENIDRFIAWLEDHVLAFDHTSVFSGASALYTFK